MSAPARILILRPDTYGDWILTEPLLRLARERFPQAELTLLLRATLADVAPLLGSGLRLLTAPFNPHASVLPADSPELRELGAQLAALAPDWVLAPTFNRTWFDRWVARQCPQARRVGYSSPPPDLLARGAEERAGHDPSDRVFTETVPVEAAALELAKLAAFGQAAFGQPLPGPPQLDLNVDRGTAERELRTLEELGLVSRQFLACAPAGVANVALKAWPSGHFASVIAWLESVHGLPTLLCAHVSERALVEEVQRAAVALGAHPRLWLGQDGEFRRLAGLQAQARAFFGNDTGAMHAAAAAGLPTLGIFGGGTWPRFQPRGPGPTASVVQPLACFGCDWRCEYGDAPCLHSLPPVTVQEALAWLLAAAPGAQRVFEVPPSQGLGPEVRDFIARQSAARKLAPPSPLELLVGQLAASEADRAQRLAVIQSQGERITALEQEIDTSLRAWTERLNASETDRAERLRVIERQAKELGEATARAALAEAALATLRQQHAASEADRAARLEVICRQAAELGEAQARAASAESTLATLREQYAASEADRAARLELIHRQGSEIASLQEELARWKERCSTTLGALETLRLQHAVSEGDRAARLRVIEQQGAELGQMRQALAEAEGQAALRAAELADLRGHFAASEADRAARLLVIEERGRALEASETDRRVQAEIIASQSEALEKLQRSRLAKVARPLGLWPK